MHAKLEAIATFYSEQGVRRLCCFFLAKYLLKFSVQIRAHKQVVDLELQRLGERDLLSSHNTSIATSED